MANRTARRHVTLSLGIAAAVVFPLLCITSLRGPGRLTAAPPAAPTPPASAPATATLYDPDPQHPWNRLHAALFVRRGVDGTDVGADRIDPLLWPVTTSLLKGPSHAAALAALDEFVDGGGPARVTDPAKRALLLSDLWSLFDWSANPDAVGSLGRQRAELQGRTARAIGGLLLDDRQMSALPDNYAAAVAAKAYPPRFDEARPDQPFLPDDLLHPNGPWVEIGISGGEVTAPVHVQSTSGRSMFRVFLRLPGGRAATVDYLKRLNAFDRPWVLDPDYGPGRRPNPVVRNPDLPQFPAGTQVALVRQMMVIDDQCRVVPGRLIQGVQLRVYLRIAPALEIGQELKDAPQAVFEFRLVRRDLFDGKAGGLRAVAPDEKDFQQLLPQGIDPLELQQGLDGARDLREPVMNCFACHAGPGVLSLNTYTTPLSPQTIRPRELSDLGEQYTRDAAVLWKGRQYDWGLLQGLRRTEAGRAR